MPVPEVSFDDILAALDIDSIETQDYYGVGVTINTNRAGFMVNLPLLNMPLLGEIQFHIYTDYESLGIDLSFQSGIKKHFDAFMRDVGEGVLWLFQEGPKVIAAGLERGADQFGKVFSKENVHDTLQKMIDGEFVLDDILADFASIAAKTLGLCEAENVSLFERLKTKCKEAKMPFPHRFHSLRICSAGAMGRSVDQSSWKIPA